jgi:hypothetical protein
MPDDDLFNSVEERLRDEARGLLADAPTQTRVAELRNTFVRRRRRRRITQTFGAASVVLLALAGVRWLRPQGTENKSMPIQTAGSVSRVIPRAEANRPNHAPGIPAARKVKTSEPEVVAIEVLVAQRLPNGKIELVRGLYVPEHTEPIDSQNLSQAERLAVSRLLGPEAGTSRHKTL